MELTTNKNSNIDPRSYFARSVKLVKKQGKTLFLIAFFSFLAASISTLNKEPAFVSSAQITLPAATMDMSTIIPGKVMGGEEQSSAARSMTGTFLSACLLPAILGSRTVSERVLEKVYSYSIEGHSVSSDLYGYLQTSNRDAAIFKLRSRIAAFFLDPLTNITTIKVTTTSPELSYQIVKEYINSIEECLYELKASTIRNNLNNLDAKLRETNEDLRNSEEALKQLRIKNRDYEIIGDPTFYLEQIRLEREIKVNEQMLKSLRSFYELTMSKLSDRGDKIYVVTEPFIPSSFTYPQIKKNLIISLMIGLLVAIAAITILVIVESIQGEEIRKWRELLKDVENDLRFMTGALHLSGGARKISAFINSLFID